MSVVCESFRNCGNAMVETLIGMLALAPFLVGIPLLGKQLDIEHKSYDAARYAAWERTVWREDGSNRKSAADIDIEARDRILGDPRAGLLAIDALRSEGVTENPLWRDTSGERLLDFGSGTSAVRLTHTLQTSPVDVGQWFVPGVAYGTGAIGSLAGVLQVRDLDVEERTFVRVSIDVQLQPLLSALSERSVSLDRRATGAMTHAPLLHRANAAVLSDSWSAAHEQQMRLRVDRLTTNELIEALEQPGRPIGLLAQGKGRPLFGEGQYGWDPDLRVRSNVLPAAYIAQE